jgi:hypothetical protein
MSTNLGRIEPNPQADENPPKYSTLVHRIRTGAGEAKSPTRMGGSGISTFPQGLLLLLPSFIQTSC